MVTVGADIPKDSLSSAAFGLGLNLKDVSRSGVVRAALILFLTNDREKAREYVYPRRRTPARLGSSNQDWVTAQVDEELADTGETPKALAIRIGLAMAAGLTREQAESWARMMVRPVGRPPKSRNEVAA